MTVEEQAATTLLAWKADPRKMVWDLWGVTPDVWQSDALIAFADTRDPRSNRIAMQACVGPGKTAVLAWMGWNFMLCHSDGVDHPNGAVTSITGDNLKDNLWKELAKWRDRSPVLLKAFDHTSERVFAREFPKTWYLSARTFSKSADPEAQGRTLSGLHSPSILYLVDESGDMAPAILRAAEQGLSNCRWGKIVTAGNPTNLQGLLHLAAVEQSDQWTVIRITGDPDDPKRSPRISLDWAQQQIANYGRTDPWVMAAILGRFPPSSMNALLGPDEVRDAIGKHLQPDVYNTIQKRIGVDVARFGPDATVLFPRQGKAAFSPVEMRGARTNEIAARIAQLKQEIGSEMELIDDTGGWAAGVIDQARLAGLPLLPINFSGKADDPRYFNKRAEMHFRAAEHVKNGGSLPDGVPSLIKEATATTYWFHEGKLRVLEKDQVKVQLQGQSPDYWDAFVLTFALVDLPASVESMLGLPVSMAGMIAAAGSRGHAKDDWDPLAN